MPVAQRLVGGHFEAATLQQWLDVGLDVHGVMLDRLKLHQPGKIKSLFTKHSEANRGHVVVTNSTGKKVYPSVAVAIFELLLVAWLRLIGSGGAARILTWTLLTVVGPAIVLAGGTMQRVIAEAALPVLVGVDSAFFTLPFLVLQLAMLALLLGPVAWCVAGWHRWSATGTGITLSVLLAAAAGAVVVATSAELPSVVAVALLPLFGRLHRRTLGSEHFAQRGLAALVILLWIAGFQSAGLDHAYAQIKQRVAFEEARKRLAPEQSNLAFGVEEIVQQWASDSQLLQTIGDPEQDRTNLAFELWAKTFLPIQGEGCRIELMARDGGTISEFDISLPYEPTPTRVWRQNAPRGGAAWSVETIELNTEQGPFLVYRGRLDLATLLPESDD